MTKREIHLEYIRIEVATEGKVTAEAIRHYIENHISRQAFQDAIDRGMAQFRMRINAKATNAL